MEETYTLGLALLDFVPNLAFFVGAYFLVRLAYLVRGKSTARIMAIGTGLIFLGGILKATWGLEDFEDVSEFVKLLVWDVEGE